MYDNLLTIDTSNPQAAYIGNNILFKKGAPIDFAETDLGYVGCQNKFMLKTPHGQITVDAKRGQVFLITGTQAGDLSGYGSGLNRFFTDHLAFEILRYFPNTDTDNHFSKIGLHGVYDTKFGRVIISKLDYIPLTNNIIYDDETKEFYYKEMIGDLEVLTKVELNDPDYFCNKSWTLSYNVNTKAWMSFHSYIPNFYIGENNFFYSGINECCKEFDAIVGELVPNPPTTTTTSTTRTTTTTTSTTAVPFDCALEGVMFETNCELEGTAIITIGPIPPACQRPTRLNLVYYYTGYSIISPASIVVSTGSQTEACAAIAYLNSLVDYSNVIVNYVRVEVLNNNVGTPVYLVNGTTDCTKVEDGWYFSNELQFQNKVIHVVDGYIIANNNCGS